MNQPALFANPAPVMIPASNVSTAPEVDALIGAGAPLLVMISGGKDSRLAAETSIAYARDLNPEIEIRLVYADLGRVVWSDAQQQCRQLAERLQVELVIVRREAGGLMERWQKRWLDNLARYVNLECVKLILPWSTPTMRFCTSELKTAIIQRWIRKTYKRPVICVLGIRRDEGRSSKSGRGAAPVIKQYQVTIKDGKEKQPNLPAGSIDWNAIVDVKTERVFQIARSSAIPLPDAYEVFGASRYSCCFCIMSAGPDLLAATRDRRNYELYREQCELEIVSTYSFQGGQWLSDVAPELLTEDQRGRLAIAKVRAVDREALESAIPKHLLYTKGWPTCLPTFSEAQLLADTRKRVSEVMGVEVTCTTPETVIARYAELMAAKRAGKPSAKPRKSKLPIAPVAV